jgi:hypothetical protein
VSHGLGPHKASFPTITYDNGQKFSDHAEMAQDLDATIYFAHPYASWERGVNETTNGLIRQFFPKHRDLTLVSDQELTDVGGKAEPSTKKDSRLSSMPISKVHTTLRVELEHMLPVPDEISVAHHGDG